MDAEATCLRRGSGTPVVLLHGFTGSPASLTGLATSAPDDGRSIWALALPGHHPRVAVAVGWDANIAALAARVAAIGHPVDVVGYSLGARCAIALACDHPTLIVSATLVGGHPGLATEEERAARRESDRVWITLLRERGIEAFVDTWQALPMWRSQAGLDPETLEAQRRIRLGHDADALADALEHLGLASMPDYRAALAATTVPVTTVTGALDDKFTALAAELGGTHRVVAGVGHNVILEAPAAIWQ